MTSIAKGVANRIAAPIGKSIVGTELNVFSLVNSFAVEENQTAVGAVKHPTLTGWTYAIKAGQDGASFNIANGVISFSSAPDYETKSAYTVTITATKGATVREKTFTVNITDVLSETPLLFLTTLNLATAV